MNWIKTSEQRPPSERPSDMLHENPRLIVWFENEIRMLYYNSHHECWDNESGHHYFCDVEDIEYWMELPEEPKTR